MVQREISRAEFLLAHRGATDADLDGRSDRQVCQQDAARRHLLPHLESQSARVYFGDSDPRLPRRLVAVLEGVTDREVVEQVDRIVQGGVVHVMVVTSEPAPVLWGELLESDGVEVVTSATSVAELAAMVTHFAEGGSSMDADGRSALLDAWRLADGRRQRLAALLATLSPQQRRVLDLLASGRRVDEVGEVIGVARGTVRSHVKAMRAKLGARTQLEAVAMLNEFNEDSVGPAVPLPRQPAAAFYREKVTRTGVPRP